MYTVAFAGPPLIVGGLNLRAELSTHHPVPALASEPVPSPPNHDDDRLTAVIVAGATGAESIDLLVPYEILSTSGAFNVYTVGPERRPLPLFPGTPTRSGTHFIPHYSIDEYDAALPGEPDLLVVPWIPNMDEQGNADVAAWMRRHVGPDTTLLTICGGSWSAAQAGLLQDGATVTTHSNIFRVAERDHPSVTWLRDRRWVEDRHVISSAGITAGIDATLRAVGNLVGRDVADATARALNYPHHRLVDAPDHRPSNADMRSVAVARAFHRNSTNVAVLLHDDVGEVELASIVDLYPRTGTVRLHPVGATHGLIRTRNGLHLMPHESLSDTSRHFDRVLVPGRADHEVAAAADRWAQHFSTGPAEPIHLAARDAFPIDAVLADIGSHHPAAVTQAVIAGIEYPFEHPLDAPFAIGLLLRPLLLGLCGVATAALIRRARRTTSTSALDRGLRDA